MKRVTASEARRNWFRLLDEVAAGAVVVIERAGRRLVLSREERTESDETLPDYASLIQAPAAANADLWGWTWEPDRGDLAPSDRDDERDTA